MLSGMKKSLCNESKKFWKWIW